MYISYTTIDWNIAKEDLRWQEKSIYDIWYNEREDKFIIGKFGGWRHSDFEKYKFNNHYNYHEVEYLVKESEEAPLSSSNLSKINHFILDMEKREDANLIQIALNILREKYFILPYLNK